jgi:YfiH family protein
VELITAELLAGLPHGFFGRQGGVSSGPWASLNCGLRSGDDPAAVRANRGRAAAALGFAPQALRTARQVHGTACVAVTEAWDHDAAPDADALVTDRPGVLLGVLTADCAPVLLADPLAGVVGACHAGWRGALDGVLGTVVDGMVALGAAPGRIRAAIGPCIAQRSYEVGPDYRAQFLAADPENDRFFAPGPRGRPHFDLAGYVAARLALAGVREVAIGGADTAAEPTRFFSHRRARLAGEDRFGLQLAAIGVKLG